MISHSHSHLVIRKLRVKVYLELCELVVQVVGVLVGLHERLQLLQPVLQEVRLLRLRSQHQEILLILVPMVVVSGSYNQHPSRVSVHFDRMLLIVVIFQIAEFSHVHRKALFDAELEEDNFCNLGLEAGVQHKRDFVNCGEAPHELFDLGDGEHGFIVVPQVEYFATQGFESAGGDLQVQRQVALVVLLRKADYEVLDFDGDYDFLFFDELDALVMFSLASPGLLELVVAEGQEDGQRCINPAGQGQQSGRRTFAF